MELAQKLMMPVLMISVMVSAGLDLRPRELFNASKDLPLMARAVLGNLIVVPLVVFTLGTLANLENSLFAAMMIAAIHPGGPMAPLFVQRAGGRLDLSVASVIFFSLAAFITTPILLSFIPGASAGELDVGTLFRQVSPMIFGYQLLPLLVAMGVRMKRPELAERLLPKASKLSRGILGVVIVGMAAVRLDLLKEFGLVAIASSIVLALLSLGLGWLSGHGTSYEERVGLALTSGVRNIALALLVCERLLSPEVTLNVMILALFMLTTSVIASRLFERKSVERIRLGATSTV